ncbi:hypothetical protein MMC10_011372 [Thelotrema lepadinum]|nr:hypothetical protein [Thelotrema lepadinum]
MSTVDDPDPDPTEGELDVEMHKASISKDENTSTGDSSKPPARLKYKPRNPTRRAEAERIEKEREFRQQLLPTETGRNAFRSGFRGRGGRRRGRGYFRGGSSDSRNESSDRQQFRAGAGPATGFLSGPTLEEAIATKGNRGRRATRAHSRLLATTEAPSTRGGRSAAGGSGGTSKKSGGIKKEGKTSKTKGKESAPFEESDDDIDVYDGDADEGGIDVDHIAFVNLVSDDEDSSSPSGQIQGGGRPRRYHNYGMNPVRVDREEHISRAMGVSTDASSAASSHIRQKAREAGISARNVKISAGDGSKAPKSKSAKARGKEREVEIVGNKSAWHGVYSDDEPEGPKIKEEEEDETQATSLPPIAAADPITQSVDPATSPPQDHEATIHVDAIPKGDTAEEPPKPRKRRGSWRPYNFQEQQTEEDHAEWQRMKVDMAEMRDILGPARPRDDGGDDSPLEDPRKDLVYLFQFPPIMPNLVTPEELAKLGGEEEADEAQESSDVEVKANEKSSGPDKPPSTEAGPSETIVIEHDGSETVIKPEDDSGKAGQSGSNNKHRPFLTAEDGPSTGGQVGTMTVYENGSTILNWGGIEFEIHKGMGSHLQEVVLLDSEDQEENRKANAMSEIANTFIATPNWEQLFEADQ